MPRHFLTQCWLLAIRPHRNKLCWKSIKIQNIPCFGLMKKCISEIQNWMNVIFLKNGLQINDKAVFFASCQSPHTWYDNEHGQRTHTPQNVRKLGVISFQTANRERHVNKVHKTAYMHMNNKIMHCITRCMRVLNSRFHHHTTGLNNRPTTWPSEISHRKIANCAKFPSSCNYRYFDLCYNMWLCSSTLIISAMVLSYVFRDAPGYILDSYMNKDYYH